LWSIKTTMEKKKIVIRENVCLADFTTFRVGGPARYFTEVSSEKEARQAFAFAAERGLSHFIIGGGSNILFSDDGFPGLVILNRIKGIAYDRDGDSILVTVGGGEDWQDFVDLCVEKGWQGIECLAGIPGTAGASPIQNVGAYGQEISQVLEKVRCLEIRTGEAVTFNNEKCAFRYRESIFNTVEAGKYLVTSVTFRLKKDGATSANYRELADRLSAIPAPTPADVRDAVMAIRDTKGLVVRAGYESCRCAGSFFKNPIVTTARFEQIQGIVARHGGGSNWAWPLPSGDVKISAACLIQCSGFDRGYRKGNAGISPRHTLILISYDGASAGEIAGFAGEVQQRVLERFGVLLLPEVRFAGFDSSPPQRIQGPDC
jgi:UDP-N-acetylmuramate dehydrogenase